MTPAGRIAIAGDALGIPQTLEVVPGDRVRGLIASSIRPQYLGELGELAAGLGVPLLVQPKYEPGANAYQAFVDELRASSFDLLICNSYSLILRPEMLDAVAGPAVNVHWSMLPRNRGPNPTQWALIRGETTTGVTLHHIDEDVDAGDIIGQVEEPIRDQDTWISLNERLRGRAAELLGELIPAIVAGTAPRRPQRGDLATVNRRLTPDSPEIRLDRMSDREVFDLIRAQVSPLQGAYIDRGGSREHLDSYLSMDEVRELRARLGG